MQIKINKSLYVVMEDEKALKQLSYQGKVERKKFFEI